MFMLNPLRGFQWFPREVKTASQMKEDVHRLLFVHEMFCISLKLLVVMHHETCGVQVLCELGTSTPDASGKREPSSLEQIVGLEHISAAVKELYGEPHMHIWRTCDPHAKVCIDCIA